MSTIPDYEFYTSLYKGDLIKSERDFNRLAVRANAEIERLEGLLSVSYFDAEKGRDFAVCALAEEAQRTEAAQLALTSAGMDSIKSVSVGSVSVSSGSMSTEQAGNYIADARHRYYDTLLAFADICHAGRWCQ